MLTMDYNYTWVTLLGKDLCATIDFAFVLYLTTCPHYQPKFVPRLGLLYSYSLGNVVLF